MGRIQSEAQEIGVSPTACKVDFWETTLDKTSQNSSTAGGGPNGMRVGAPSRALWMEPR
jgi:hypothetical protein